MKPTALKEQVVQNFEKIFRCKKVLRDLSPQEIEQFKNNSESIPEVHRWALLMMIEMSEVNKRFQALLTEQKANNQRLQREIQRLKSMINRIKSLSKTQLVFRAISAGVVVVSGIVAGINEFVQKNEVYKYGALTLALTAVFLQNVIQLKRLYQERQLANAVI